jgi:hypothetical protein
MNFNLKAAHNYQDSLDENKLWHYPVLRSSERFTLLNAVSYLFVDQAGPHGYG